RAVLLAVQPGRRPGRLDAEPNAALAGRQYQLVRLQLDDERGPAGLHRAWPARGLAGVPVHRGCGLGWPENDPVRVVRGGPGRWGRPGRRLPPDHLSAAEADL